MEPLNVKTPGGSRAQGEAAVQGDLNSAQVTPHGPAACQCHINKYGCLVCRRWDRTIRSIDTRRAASLRLQALGLIGGTRRAPGMML